MLEPFLEISNVSVQTGEQTVLAPISLSLLPGKKLAVAGETGSGKSTLLKSIAGLQNLSRGSVLLKGKRVEEPWEKLIPGHPEIAYLSQHFELRNNYRVGEILSYAEKISASQASEIYLICQIDHLLQRKTDQLSGGERQRIAMARLLVGAPAVFLLDEPFSNLDVLHKQIMKQVMVDLGRAMQINWVLVSHDPGDWLSWADELLILRNGQRVMQGDPTALYFEPADDYAAGLLGPYSRISAKEWELLSGEIAPGSKIIRPGQLELVPVQLAAVQGRIEAVEFIGYGYLLTIRISGQTSIQVFHSSAISIDSPVGVKLR